MNLIRMTVQKKPDAVKEIEQLLLSHKIGIQSVRIQKTAREKIKLEFDVIYPHKLDKPSLFCLLAEHDEILSLGE